MNKLLQGTALGGEIAAEHVGKMVVALSQREHLIANRDLIEAICIEPMPRELGQSQLLEESIQRLSLTQSAYIVKACIKLQTNTTVALQASTWTGLTLENEHASSTLRQLSGTNQTSQSTTNHYDIVYHQLL